MRAVAGVRGRRGAGEDRPPRAKILERTRSCVRSEHGILGCRATVARSAGRHSCLVRERFRPFAEELCGPPTLSMLHAFPRPASRRLGCPTPRLKRESPGRIDKAPGWTGP